MHFRWCSATSATAKTLAALSAPRQHVRLSRLLDQVLTEAEASVGDSAIHAVSCWWHDVATPENEQNVSKASVIGYIISFLGTALWIYGYFTHGNPSLIDWQANSPRWIAEFLPNIESEIGMALAFISIVPIYWPTQFKNHRRR